MAPPAQAQRSSSPSQPSGKGEVADVKSQLRNLAGSRAPGVDDSKRELFKKVISYMTIGIDVSSVFGEMVMCSATSDIVLKKMCYLYVGNYAKVNPDLALLTINFLQRDCKDEDPMIRGLALRSLCSLRVTNLVEYLVGPLGAGLKDNNSYVRMIAVMGVLKLYHISASTCVDADFPTTLKHLLLNDRDTQVVANCLSALQEIWSLEGSASEEVSREREILLSKPVIYYLLNRIREFSEWAQCLVLELVAKYVPADPNEIFDVMNLLEDRLQHANGAVVLATTKVFLQLTLSMTDVHQQVYERIKAPLLTLVSSGSPEQSYAVLSHLHLLVMRAPFIFSSDYKHFYCQYNEPSYVKKLKLEMLTAVANESNTYEIVTELCEYAANVDIPIARESIRAVGKIALQQYDVNAIVDRLLQFLEMEKDYVTAEALVLVKDLLRKYPQWSQDCIAVVGNISSKNVQEPKAKAALIWMLGEYSHEMHDAPYILEGLIENWEDEHSAEVRLHLLTAVMKCFFKRAPETQKSLGAALAAGLADFHQDVHDRALFYYRLLQYNISVAERVVNPPKQAVSVFADTQSSEIKDRIFDEFNSLSVVYQKPSYMFTYKEHRGPFEFSDEIGNLSIGTESTDTVVPNRVEANDKDLLLSTSEKEETRGLNNSSSAYSAPSYDASSLSVPTSQLSELAISNPSVSGNVPQPSFAIDDLLGLGLPTAPAPAPSPPPLKLNPKAVLDPTTFQQKWRQLPISLLRSMISEKNAVSVLRRGSWFIYSKNLVPNLEMLRESGMPLPCISLLLARQPTAFALKPKLLVEVVDRVEQMGFNMQTSTSVHAMCVLLVRFNDSNSVWNRNCEVYKRWGWSEDDVLFAFRRYPFCMNKSETKIASVMDFLVNKMGWPQRSIVKYPTVMGLSMESRIIPRCLVVKVLVLKGLIKEIENVGLSSLLAPAEECFLDKFVFRYIDEVPQLLSVYEGKVEIQDV